MRRVAGVSAITAAISAAFWAGAWVGTAWRTGARHV